MPSSEDVKDYLESLVIFNQICPSAIDHLPVMSRRVFDVGLDMSRMRHSLKPHRKFKRSKSAKSGIMDGEISGQDIDGQAKTQQDAKGPRLKRRSSTPELVSPERSHGEPSTEDAVVDGDSSVPPSETNDARQVNGDTTKQTHANPLGHHPPNGDSKTKHRSSSDGSYNFEFKPPPPNIRVKHIDTLSAKLLSADHLHVILKDPSYFLRFSAFLNRYQPHLSLLLIRYLEAQKVYKAIEYANAVSETLKLSTDDEKASVGPAASLNTAFDEQSKNAFDTLVTEALPAYITTSLTKVVTEYMVREITGTGVPVMRELVGGLAEVFCLADPSLDDCPIIYASEEFYRTSRYSRDDVLGRNCRFLQGPKSERATVDRIRNKIKAGQECCEVILNYRRDGNPFMNLLLIAPLYDDRGAVKYFIGAQVDVSGLIDDGRGLESFEQLLHESRKHKAKPSTATDESSQSKHLRALDDLAQMLTAEESAILTQHTPSPSRPTSSHISSPATPRRNKNADSSTPRRQRTILGASHDGDPPSPPLFPSNSAQPSTTPSWSLSSSLPSGKLPGVYQNYLLVRPHPKGRIVFVSPSLRIPGLLQSKFLDHVIGPPGVRKGVQDAIEEGESVTARVEWSVSAHNQGPHTDGNDTKEQKIRYISCTPLLGSDDEVGVWMVVMVENEAVTGSLRRKAPLAGLRAGNVDGDGAEEDYAGFMKDSAVSSKAPSRGNDSGVGSGEGKMGSS